MAQHLSQFGRFLAGHHERHVSETAQAELGGLGAAAVDERPGLPAAGLDDQIEATAISMTTRPLRLVDSQRFEAVEGAGHGFTLGEDFKNIYSLSLTVSLTPMCYWLTCGERR